MRKGIVVAVAIVGAGCSSSSSSSIGTGTCSQPAAPQSGSSAPLTIGDFTFTAHIGTFP